MSRIRSIPIGSLPNYHSPETRYLYAVAEVDDHHTIKIGRAAHPLWRMSELQVGNHRWLTLLRSWGGSRNDIKALERYIHATFEHRRVTGEWFRVSVAEIDDAIAKVPL